MINWNNIFFIRNSILKDFIYYQEYHTIGWKNISVTKISYLQCCNYKFAGRNNIFVTRNIGLMAENFSFLLWLQCYNCIDRKRSLIIKNIMLFGWNNIFFYFDNNAAITSALAEIITLIPEISCLQLKEHLCQNNNHVPVEKGADFLVLFVINQTCNYGTTCHHKPFKKASYNVRSKNVYLHMETMSPEKTLYSGGTSSPIQTHWRGPAPAQNPTMYSSTADRGAQIYSKQEKRGHILLKLNGNGDFVLKFGQHNVRADINSGIFRTYSDGDWD